jgi:hypothetical protein
VSPNEDLAMDSLLFGHAAFATSATPTTLTEIKSDLALRTLAATADSKCWALPHGRKDTIHLFRRKSARAFF